MKRLIIVYALVLISVVLASGCGRQQDAQVSSATPSTTDLISSDSELCNALSSWKQGVSHQIVNYTHQLAFYDQGIFQLDFVTGTSVLITNGKFDLVACKITITDGALSIDKPEEPHFSCGGWFNPCYGSH